MKKLLLLCVLGVFSMMMKAQEITVKGTVRDSENDQIVASASVSLLRMDSTLVGGMVTDNKGRFLLRQIVSGDYRLSVTFVGYKPSVVVLKGLAASIDLKDVWLEPEAVELREVSVEASSMVRRLDRQLLFPSKEQVEKSTTGLDLTRRLALPRIMVDPNTRSISMANGNVQLRINGIAASSLEIAALSPGDIKRVEYHDNPGLRYGEGVDVVLDYITVKRTSGGNFGVDLTHQLNTFWMGDYIYGKYNHGKSEFSLSSFMNGHRYKESWTDRTETFYYPDKTFQREQKGIPGKDYENYWATTANYNYTEGDDYFLNARLNLLRYDYPHYYNSSLLSNNQTPEVSELTDNNNRLTTRPSLDVYFYKKLPRKQSIVLNVVGTYSKASEDHSYLEKQEGNMLTDINTHVNGKRYSVIGEGIYEKELSAGRITGGLKHTQAYTDNLYTGSGDYKTHMVEAESYLYAQYVGEWKKLVYNVGLGVSRNYLSQEDVNSYDRWYFRPRVSLTYNINKVLTLRYNYQFRNQNPSLSQLSDVEQWIDSLQIRKGNPDLTPYFSHYNSLNFSVNTAKVKTGFFISYSYLPDIVMGETRYDASRRLFIQTYANQRGFHRLTPELYLNYSPFGDYLSINLSGGLNHFISKGNDYSHTYTDGYYAISLNSDVKKFDFGLFIYKRAFSFSGESSSQADRYNMVSVGYRLGKVKLGASASIPFYGKTALYRTKNYSALTPYVSDKKFGDIYPAFRLTFSYHIDFGRKYKSTYRKVNNADNESGILDSRK